MPMFKFETNRNSGQSCFFMWQALVKDIMDIRIRHALSWVLKRVELFCVVIIHVIVGADFGMCKSNLQPGSVVQSKPAASIPSHITSLFRFLSNSTLDIVPWGELFAVIDEFTYTVRTRWFFWFTGLPWHCCHTQKIFTYTIPMGFGGWQIRLQRTQNCTKGHINDFDKDLTIYKIPRFEHVRRSFLALKIAYNNCKPSY